MKLLDFFRAWYLYETREYIENKYPAELTEGAKRGWVAYAYPHKFYITPRGHRFYNQLEGDYS